MTSNSPQPESFFSRAEVLSAASIADRIKDSHVDEIIAWPQEELPVLFAAADRVRRAFFADRVEPCSLMNVKAGGCAEDCAFCAQSAHNKAKVNVRPLATEDEIVSRFERAREQGVHFCVVSSGTRLGRQEIERVAAAIRRCRGVEVHASLGILDDEDFRLLRDAGVTCYNHNLETSPTYYSSIVTTHDYSERVATVRRAKAAGLRVCCGGIFGMGESWQDRKAMCLALKELEADTIPLNFFNPVAGTRLPRPAETALDFLKIVVLFRLVHSRKIIKVCGGRELHLGKLQGLLFMAGANGYVTGGYLTTTGDGIESDDTLIQAMGLVRDRT
jgi:biotin synthase